MANGRSEEREDKAAIACKQRYAIWKSLIGAGLIKKVDMSSSDDQSHLLEGGFLLLENCTLHLSVDDGNDSKGSQLSTEITNRWLSVDVPHPGMTAEKTGDAHLSKETGERATTENAPGPTSRYCSHCHAPIHIFCNEDSDKPSSPARIGIAKARFFGVTPRFDGTIADCIPDKRLCTCHGAKPSHRSDVALFLGLAQMVHDLGHIRIRSIQILVTSGGRNLEKNVNGSMCITFDIVQARNSSKPRRSPLKQTAVQHRRPQNEQPPRKFFTSSSKVLPYATQTLLSIMRSDWEALDSLQQKRHATTRGQPKQNLRKPYIPLFPTKLSLEAVYQRIRGVQEYNSSSLSVMSPLLGQDTVDKNFILLLPDDILTDHICAFLKAKSLDALRCSCKNFHKTLQVVIPGLKLKLYAHQLRSLSWMRSREVREYNESDISDVGSSDSHRAATGGATVLIRSRAQPEEIVRIAQHNGEEVTMRLDNPLSRKLARGGLLCDDPGLGKTVTVLALLLQTLGLTTEKDGNSQLDVDKKQGPESLDERIFREYWMEQSIPQYRCQAMRKLLLSFIRQHPSTNIFMYPVDPETDGVPDYLDVVKEPICFQDIQQRNESLDYDLSFDKFVADVIRCFSNAVQYHPRQSGIHKEAIRLKSSFLDQVELFKNKQVQLAKKSFARTTSKPNSSVAALVERNNQIKLQESLTPSRGTLLVVPSVLLEHWQDQIRLHINLNYCTAKKVIIFEYTGTAENGLRMEEIVRQCKVEKTHSPVVFIDKTGIRRLPSPQFLAMFFLVITTNRRFTNEWKNGSFEEELRQSDETKDTAGSSMYDYRASLTGAEEACSLLKVNWLRMVVDEGHSMGRGQENSAISFASWISAERRWAMTGTPTRQTVSQSGLASILNLVQFLQHDFFSRRQDGQSVWQNLIARGWTNGSMSSFFRLRSLLSLLMVRHTKRDIEELPLPLYHDKILPMSAEETKTYNTLVCAVQSNLLITSMEGKTSGLQDSLLHRSQARHAKEALRNVRLVCSGGTQVTPTVSDQFWREFLDDFRQCNANTESNKKMSRYLSDATSELVTPCDCCNILLTTQLVFPCGHLVCTECADPKVAECVVCDKPFDVDLFQRLQPGMDYQWRYNLDEELKKGESRTMAPPVGRVAVNEDGSGILSLGNSLVPRRRTAKPGDDHNCVYDAHFSHGQCTMCWKEHDGCNLLSDMNRCKVCYRRAEACPSFETKPFYIVEKLEELITTQRKYEVTKDRSNKFARRPVKVIVFSQFRKVLNTTGDRLIRRFGTACIAEYWGKFRRKELHKFVNSDECFCMLLGKDGSEGLDLSFVTNIIFTEQIWDKSLEEQVVARAWRMGAMGAVEVESLIAENSVEETMTHLEAHLGGKGANVRQDDEDPRTRQLTTSHMEKAGQYQRAKLQFLLQDLKLITTSTTNPLSAPADSDDRKRPKSSSNSNPHPQVTKRRKVQFAA